MKKATALVAVLLILCTALCACGKADESFFGEWTCNQEGYKISIHFNEDGTGYHESAGGLLTVAFAYNIQGDKITIHELNQEVLGSDPYTFSVKGDKLTLTSDSITLEFTKE